MVKQRMATADVAGEVACLRQRVLGMRVANLYDLNSKTYMLKLAKSGEDGEKAFLVLESGSRFHTTQYQKEKSDTPSNFTLKLRKHLRTRRLEDIKQLGVDRIVDFQFGSGDARYHLILELYSQGNLILADSNYEVLTLLRSHRDDAKGFAIMARHPYPVHTIRLRQAMSQEQLEAALESADEKQTLRGALNMALPYGPAVADHCILLAGLSPQQQLKAKPLGPAQRQGLLTAVQAWEKWLDDCESEAPKGYITYRRADEPKRSKKQSAEAPITPAQPVPASPAPDPGQASGTNPSELAKKLEGIVYEDFDPLLLKQNEGLQKLEFETYDAALDEFYARIEGQQVERNQSQQEKAALAKLDRIKLDQGKRADDLERDAAEAESKAALIEYNLEAVDAAINAVREALASGLDWRELGQMIKAERRAGNPVAGLIDSLALDKNKITVVLENFLDEEDADDEAMTRPATKVELDLDFNAYANARIHYEKRKQHMVKQQKTVDANEKALKAAEKKAQQQLSQVRTKTAIQHVRKPLWFEKFNWFVTSENYLVISGRDAQQNELIVKRYLKKGDLYVHADLHGAASTIIKNHEPEKALPPLSISQAGCACVCRSAAWDAKIVTSAWWVHHQQVSKTAPTGEYLTVGSFMIRGKKNFLPPNPLVMGFAFLFKLDESSIAAHLGERAPKLADGESVALDQQDATEDLNAEDVPDTDDLLEDGADAASQPATPAAGSQQGSGNAASALEAFLDSAAQPTNRQMQHAQSYSRYGLSAPEEASGSGPTSAADEEADANNAAAGATGRRHVSAKERKLMKKQGAEAATGGSTTAHGLSGSSAAGHTEAAASVNPSPATSPALAAATGNTAGQTKQQSDGESLEAGRKAEKARREAKAGGGASKEQHAQGKGEQTEGKGQQAQGAAQTQPQQQAVRGKKTKFAKAKAKYADQDEEDRELAMQFLGAAGGQKSKQEKKEAHKAKLKAKKGDDASAATTALLNSTPTPEALAAVGANQMSKAAAERQAEIDKNRLAWQQRTQGATSRVASGNHAASEGAVSAGAASDSQAISGPGNAGDAPAASPGSAGHTNGPHGIQAETKQQVAGDGDGTNGSTSSSEEEEGKADTAGSGQQRQRTSTAEQQEIAALLAEENVEVLDPEDRDRLTQLDSLTGAPRLDDVLLFAVPVCAPYSALQGYKYKLKLTPGTQRKGKAARQAVELLSRQADAPVREKDFIKAVPDMDMINAFVGTVKLSMPGLVKIKQDVRKNKKKK
ncbi:hypothetical protein WJX77_005710 [Trebouxia sp. C0004]